MNPEINTKLILDHGTKNLGFGADSSSHPMQSSTCSTYDSFLRIAEITIGLACNSSDLTIDFTGAIEKFLVGRGEPEIKIEVCWDGLKEKTQGKEIFNSKTNWKLYSYNESYLFRFTSPAYGSIPYKEALFNSDFSAGKIRLNRPVYSSEQPIDPLEYPLDEMLVLNYLSCGRGVEVQACGVVNSQGDGYLFLDQSGAGKSATARQWMDQPQFMVLADNRIILRRQEGILWIYSTPWQEDTQLASPARAPLKRVYFLRKGMKNELIPLSRADVVGRFLACSFPLSYSQESVDFIISFFERIPSNIPCFELRFLSDTEIVDSILGEAERPH
jgi:hypothetical protein